MRDWRRDAGAIPGPFEAWLAHRSLADARAAAGARLRERAGDGAAAGARDDVLRSATRACPAIRATRWRGARCAATVRSSHSMSVSEERAERFLAAARARHRRHQLRHRAHDRRAARTLGRRRRAARLHPAVRRLRGHGRPARRRGARTRRGVSGPLLVTGGSGYLGRELLRAAERRDRHPSELGAGPGPAPTGCARRPRRRCRRRALRSRAARGRDPHRLPPERPRRRGHERGRIGARGAAAARRGPARAHLHGPRLRRSMARARTARTTSRCRSATTAAQARVERAVLDAHPDALVVRTSLMVGGAAAGRQERAPGARRGRVGHRLLRRRTALARRWWVIWPPRCSSWPIADESGLLHLGRPRGGQPLRARLLDRRGARAAGGAAAPRPARRLGPRAARLLRARLEPRPRPAADADPRGASWVRSRRQARP